MEFDRFGSMDTEVEVKEVKKRRVRQKVVADQVEEARPMDFTNCNVRLRYSKNWFNEI